MRTTSLLLLCACYAAPPEVDAPVTSHPMADPVPVPSDPHIVCDMSKFSFTQPIGCANDGWVEFCATKAGAPVVNALRAVASDLDITEGMIGSAGCDELNDYDVRKPVAPSDCMAVHGA